MNLLFLLLSVALAQESPRPEFRDENAYQLLLQMRNGTPVLTSSPTYRGKPTFGNGIIFGDGTEQTTAATGDSFSSAFNTSASPGLINKNQISMYATSMDGATQSSGCVVHVYYSDQGPSAAPLFTSTTTASMDMRNKTPAVLLESCAPGSNCRVGVNGIYRVQLDGGALASAFLVETSATRCRVLALGGTADDRIVGKSLHVGGAAANSFIWIRLMEAQ